MSSHVHLIGIILLNELNPGLEVGIGYFSLANLHFAVVL